MAPTPDHVPCRHCKEPISWDEYCWTHDSSGFATCGTVISGGRHVGEGHGVSLTVDPDIRTEGLHAGKTALPIGEWS